jgi:hypothetical protein
MKIVQDYVIYERPGQSKRYAKIVFMGILVFLAIYFPFFGYNMRYQLGEMLRRLFDFIGFVCLGMGAINIAVGAIGLFRGRTGGAFSLVIGALLLWIGCWLTGIVINIFGFDFGGSTVSNPGYH